METKLYIMTVKGNKRPNSVEVKATLQEQNLIRRKRSGAEEIYTISNFLPHKSDVKAPLYIDE